MIKINSITELKTRIGTSNANAQVLGYDAVGDGGGRYFYWDNSSIETDNGDTVISVTGVPIGRWKIVAKKEIDVISSSLNIEKNVYSKQEYSSNNFVLNSNFSSSLTSWTENNMVSSLGGSLASVENISGKNWLKLNCSDTSTTISSRGYIEQVVSIPSNLRNSLLEFSFDVYGYYQGVNINTEENFSLNVIIEQSKPERFYIYINPNGASTVSVKLYRCVGNQEIAGQFVYYSNIQLTEAIYETNLISPSFPSKGLNLQFARWSTDWDVFYQEKYLNKVKEITPFLRVWISSELFANYTLKNSPTKRTVASSGSLSALYNSATTAKLLTTFNNDIYKLDWFFNKCSELGIKLHVVLGTGFTDNNGNPHPTLALQSLYEFLDSDSDVQDSVTDYFVNVVNRYKKYSNIIGWEFNNEGYLTWRTNYAGYNTTASYSMVRSASYAGYKNWERNTYNAIKLIDSRPILLDLYVDSSSTINLVTDDICDWFTPSYYGGSISLTPSNIGSNRFFPTKNFPNVIGSLENGFKLIPYAPSGSILPTGLVANTTYYIVNITSTYFELSASLGGSTIVVSGGTGTFYFYSPDGGLIEYDSPILNNLKESNKFLYFAEFGSPILSDNLTYRNEDINSEYIKKIITLQGKYGITSVMFFDEHNLFFDVNFSNKKTAQSLIASDIVSLNTPPIIEKLSNNFSFEGNGTGIVRIIKKTSFSSTSTGIIGSLSFGVKDESSTFNYKEGARISAYSTANYGNTNKFESPTKLVLELEKGTTSSSLTNVMEFNQTQNVSNQDLTLPSSAYNLKRLLIGGLRIWQNLSGKLILKQNAEPSSDSDGNLLMVNGMTDFAGFGTNSPATKVHIVDSGANLFRIERTGVGASGMTISTQMTSSVSDLVFDGANASSGFLFRARDAANAIITALGIDRLGRIGVNTLSPTEVLDVNGNIQLKTAGNKLKITTGGNASIGTATLVAGTVTVATTAVTTSSLIFLTYNTPIGTLASGLSAPTASVVNGTSFVINSLTTAGMVNVLDVSTVRWWIIN